MQPFKVAPYKCNVLVQYTYLLEGLLFFSMIRGKELCHDCYDVTNLNIVAMAI